MDAFVTSQEAPEASAETSAIHCAIENFQEGFATKLSWDKLVAGFGVLEEDSKARTFLAIKGQENAWAWMERQIQMKMGRREN